METKSKCRLTIGRCESNKGEDYMQIRVRQGKELTKITVDLATFMQILTGKAEIEVEISQQTIGAKSE